MKKIFGALAASAALAAANPAAAATIVNAGFETGDLTGWTANNGLTSVVTSFGAYSAYEGKYFAALSAGAGTNQSTVLSQLFEMVAGETIQAAVAFVGGDYLPYNDAGALGILNFISNTNTVLFSKDIAAVGDYGSTPWTVVSFTAPTTGTYYISGNVKNIEDNLNNSFLLLDTAAGAVPEPSTWAMMILGIGFAGAAMRRRQNQTVRYNFA